MSTYNSTANKVVNTKYIIQIDENGNKRLVQNPSWTAEQENQLKSLVAVTPEDFKKKAELVASSNRNVYMNKEAALKKNIKKIYEQAKVIKRPWNPTDKILDNLKKKNYAQEVDILFTSTITPDEFFSRLYEIKEKKNGKSIKWCLLQYFFYLVFIKGFKTLHQCQEHLAKHLDCTRPWVNEVIAELKKDGILTSLYRHLCSCLYSMNHLFVDMFYRDQLEELFGGVYTRWNTYQQRKFTQEVTFKYKSIIKLNSYLINEEDFDQKKENRGKISSILQNLNNSLTKKTPVLCPFAK